MSNENGRHWTWLERTSNIISVVTSGPILAGLSVLGALLSQNVPFISAYGFFGAFIIGLGSFLVLCVCVAMLSIGARKRPEAEAGRKNTPAVWPWIIGLICIVAGLSLLHRRPSIPAGFSLSTIDLPVASYNEMRNDVISGKTVVITEVPRDNRHVMLIREKRFENCLILGPAVLAPTGRFTMLQNEIGIVDNDPESVLLEVKRGSTIGMIEVRDCAFVRCRFRSVSFAGTKPTLDLIRTAN